ncbi:hypothetical protein BP00DRAFT_278499 [Aspergillus indologenus CBS 114.80]|uniref:Uncharacterized protein n=1 Tax=Aspergillus indologenus CBS 114.80 TaxID=1450541 RepID=A0A2V5J2U0_9EURO|nr:hypothetical protein BP00DRAFT_278499 [Aspergillus indologenus CBS 114.80]
MSYKSRLGPWFDKLEHDLAFVQGCSHTRQIADALQNRCTVLLYKWLAERIVCQFRIVGPGVDNPPFGDEAEHVCIPRGGYLFQWQRWLNEIYLEIDGHNFWYDEQRPGGHPRDYSGWTLDKGDDDHPERSVLRGQCWLNQIRLRHHGEEFRNFTQANSKDLQPLQARGREYSCWALDEGVEPIFHVIGKPGSGKSMHVEGDLKYWKDEYDFRSNSWLDTTKQTLEATIFFRKSQQEGLSGEQNFNAMIRAILSELLQRENYICFARKRTVPELACLLFPGRAKKMPCRPLDFYVDEWDEGRVAAWQARVPSDYFIGDFEALSAWNRLVTSDAIYEKHRIFLHLDGLNQLNPADHTRILDALTDWVRLRPRDVKICITSCGEPAFQKALGSYPGYNLNEVKFIEMLWYVHALLTGEGIETTNPAGGTVESRNITYFYAVWRKYASLGTVDERNQLERRIVEMADGSFRWLVKFIRGLVQEDICSGDYGPDPRPDARHCLRFSDLNAVVEKRFESLKPCDV